MAYLPAPLILASAIAARTEHLALNLVVMLPLYDPVRLAEEMAVVDIISNGRVSYILGLGYRPGGIRAFGKDLARRGRHRRREARPAPSAARGRRGCAPRPAHRGHPAAGHARAAHC